VFTLRDGRSSDRPFLDGLLDAQGMAAGADPAEFVVATDDGGGLGAARAEVVEGEAWVRPIAVLPSAQGQGVGSVLLLELLRRYGVLSLVARGAIAGFYHRRGFIEVGWDRVPGVLREECDKCPCRSECRPRPMRGPSWLVSRESRTEGRS